MSQMAAELGLSRVAVSAVVNGNLGKIRLAASTVQRVRDHLHQRGYVRSRHALHLQAAPTRVIGILQVDRLYGHLVDAFHRLVEGLGGAASGLEVIVTSRERLETAIQEIRGRGVTDLVWIHNNSTCEDYRDESVGRYFANTRLVVYNFPFDSPLGEGRDLLDRGFALVGVHRATHTRQLARFLRGLGHKAIALPDVDMTIAPHQFYRDLFAREGLTVAESPLPFRAAEFLDAMRRQRITAAWFHGDSPACQAIGELKALGVRVPEDLTVIGFDGTSRPFSQELTTLAMPVRAMVAKVRAIVSGTEKGLRHCFDMELVKGRTHGPAWG